MLKINNLVLKHKNKIIINNVSFALKESEQVTIIGKSGSGKSLLVRSILNLNDRKVFSYQIDSLIEYRGRNILNISEKNLRNIRGKEISMVFQDPFLSLNPSHDILKQLKEMFLIHNISDVDIEKQIAQILKDVGLEIFLQDKSKIFPHQLSGGQRQRLNIAIAAILKPKLIIADEVTTALDNDSQKLIIKLLDVLRVKYKVAIIFVTHDLELAKKFNSRIILMDQGSILADLAKFSELKIIDNIKIKKLIEANDLKILRPNAMNEEVIKVENLCVKYESKGFFSHEDNIVIDNLSFTINKGETLGVVGKSGSGKSSLARSLLRLQNCSGMIWYNNLLISDLDYKSMKSLRRDLQIIYQDPYASLNPKMKICNILYEGLNAHKIKNSNLLINKVLKEVGLGVEFLNRYPVQMSGGERQKLAIARSLILMPKFLILDEPTASLDKFSQKEIIMLLLRLQRKYQLSYMFISHDVNLVKKFSHRYIAL